MSNMAHSFASMVARSTGSWGFGALDKIEDGPIKIENESEENEDIVMEEGSDSDVEIISFNTPAGPAPEKVRPRVRNPTPSSSGERPDGPAIRKREGSYVDLAREESPTKKMKKNVTAESNKTHAEKTRPSTISKKNTAAPSKNSVPVPRKKTLMGSLLGLAGRPFTTSDGSRNTFNQHSSSRKSPDPTTPNGTSLTSRRRMPFDEDDSDEDFGAPELSSKPAATPKVFNRMWSEPQSSNVKVRAYQPHRKPLNLPSKSNTTGTETPENAASRSESITYRPFKPNTTSRKSTAGNYTGPDSSVRSSAANAASTRLASILQGIEAPKSVPPSTFAAQQAVFGSDARNSARSSLDVPQSTNHQDTLYEASVPQSNGEKDTKPPVVDLDEQKCRRQENSRKMQERLMAQLKSSSSGRRAEKENVMPNCGEFGLIITDRKPSVSHYDAPDSSPSTAVCDAKRLRKEEAANARRQADLHREREAAQRAQEKLESETRQWEERNRLKEMQREKQRRREHEAQDEANILSERMKALSKLHQTNAKTTAAKKAEEASQPSKSSFNAVLEIASARPEPSQSQVPRKEEQHNTAKPYEAAGNHATGPTSSSDTALPERPTAREPSRDAKAQRIQQKIERNEMHRKAEEEQRRQQEQIESETRSTSSLPAASPSEHQPTGPVSLNSVAGQKLLVGSKTNSQSHSLGSLAKRNHKRKLGEILPEDFDLIKWKDSMSWAEVITLFKVKYNQSRAEPTLRSRYKQVREAIENVIRGEADSKEIWDDLVLGSEEAKRKIKRKIHGALLPDNIAPAAQPHKTSNIKSRPALHVSRSNNILKPSTLSPQSSSSSRTLQASPAADLSQGQYDASERPRTGGKTMDAQTFKYYLEGAIEAWEKVEEEEREPSPFNDDDYIHFAYQVERRELCQDAIDEGQIIDDENWVRCGDTFDTLLEANIAAIEHILRSIARKSSAVDVASGYEHKTEVTDGMEFHQLTGNGGGVRQVRVTRFMRTWDEGILPQSKEAWAPRTVYFIKERTTTTRAEGLFGEEKKQINETDVDNKAYTELELANVAAIKKFVQMTFTPRSGHLFERSLEIQKAEARLMNELDDDEFFHQSAEDEEGLKKVDVWVDEGELEGPRNLD